MRKIEKIVKKIILSILLLYSYNLIATSLNLVIPINCVTVGIITILDAPGLLLLVIILKLFYWG